MNPPDVLVRQGGIHWYDFGPVWGSEPSGHRPALVIQGDEFDHSAWRTTVLAPISANTALMRVHGTVFLPKEETGLPHDSVVRPTHLLTVKKFELEPAVGRISREMWQGVRVGVTRCSASGAGAASGALRIPCRWWTRAQESEPPPSTLRRSHQPCKEIP